MPTALPRPVRVLVVDDERAVRAALERALRLERFDVATAVDGQDALDTLSVDRFDAIILDVMMPRLDGLELCRRLRDAGDRTPVLMLTARDAVDDLVEGSTPAPTTTSSSRSRCRSSRPGCARCCGASTSGRTHRWRSRTCGWTRSPTRRSAASAGCG